MFITDTALPPVAAETIVVTAARGGEQEGESPASVTVVAPERAERLGEPLLANLLLVAPSASVATSGTAGSLTQVRLRGAEANHTLLFIDGIRANDPASGNEPRFELLGADLGDRIELVRGPQSALWGSEAIGGVVAVSAAPRQGFAGHAEGGSFGFHRFGASGGLAEGKVTLGLAAGLQGADGINSFSGGPGDRDGYANSMFRGRLDWRSGGLTLTASGFAIRARSEFDGTDPLTFRRSDTADSSRNRLEAGRLAFRFEDGGWKASGGLSRLGSGNRNLLAAQEQNRTAGRRDTGLFELSRTFATGALEHRLTGAAEASRERFSASDTAFGGFTNQRRTRAHEALTAEWRGRTSALTATLAVRHDRFSAFRDATTLRAGVLGELGAGLSLAASYGEGIAQPTFFDLFGFFPGSFRGNAGLRPERSHGGELSLRAARGAWRGAVTLYRQRLRHEIVERFLPDFTATVENAAGTSRRNGVEVEGGWRPGAWLNLTGSYAYLDSREPAGRELRRPRHSGALAADGAVGGVSYGALLAYNGARRDRDFDSFPAPMVRLAPYWLASARLSTRLSGGAELFGRVANALDSEAVDVLGYRREGRSVHVGLRARLGG